MIDDIIVSFLKDLKSLRYWLIIFGFIFNFYVLGLVAAGKVHYSVSITSIGLLTMIYTFFYASKNAQATKEHEIRMKTLSNGGNASDEDI